MAVVWYLVSTVVLCFAHHVTGTCNDIDTTACQLMHQKNPTICQEMGLAETACPRFCGLCPLACYHCDAAARNATDCVNMKVCAVGENCLLASRRSNIDGHWEYKMNCATTDQCEGAEFMSLMGKRHGGATRSLSMDCCSTDLCNSPASYFTTTTTTTTTVATTQPTTTTTQAPTTSNPRCIRDIEILVEDSDHQTSADTRAIQTFLKQLVSSLNISPQTNQVGLAVFDNNTHGSHHLDDDKNQLLRDIDDLHFQHKGLRVDMDHVVHFLEYRNHGDLPGGRSNVDNVIIMVFDNSARSSTGSAHWLNRPTPTSALQKISHDVIVINVGTSTSTSSGWLHNLYHYFVNALATDPNHLLQVSNYHSLATIQAQIMALLCT